MKFDNIVHRTAAILVFSSLTVSGFAQDWPAFRGADGRGSARPGGVLSRSEPVALKVRWKRKLGSGYSSVVIAGDRAVTMYTDGEKDYAVCLDCRTGDTIWQSPTGAAFKGENGSFDGPIATPVVYEGKVYALDPAGGLFCLDLENGNEIWARDLVKQDGAVKPFYGFATSPIVTAGHLIVQTGVKGKSLAAYDRQTGEPLWSATDDSINSQTPVAIDISGTSLVVAAGRKKLSGVDPHDGRVLFEFEHGGGNASAVVPVDVGDGRVVLTLDDGFSSAVSVRPADEGRFHVSGEWQDRSIKNTYNVPVLANGNLFAYSTRILVCVDPKTGQARWKSRDPGDGFLIAIDDHLIINTKQGSLHLGRASADRWQEVASMALFDELCWSLPAYSGNAVYCRSLGEVACVELVTGDTGPIAAPSGQAPPGPSLASLIKQLESIDDPDRRSEAVDRWMETIDSFPLVEQGTAHFIYRGEAGDVALAGDMFGSRQETAMTRLPGTDLFYHALQLEADQRLNYVFLVDYVPRTDPLNPRTTTSTVYAGEMEFAVRLRNEKPLEMSWLAMPAWREPDYLPSSGDQTKLAGSLVRHGFKSTGASEEIEVDVYLPPGYDANSDERFRTVYVFGGAEVFSIGQMDRAVDRILSSDQSVSPCILVNVNLPRLQDPVAVVADELVPSIDAKFRTIADRQHRSAAGFGFVAGPALRLGVEHAALFGGAAAYSPLLFDAELAAVVAGAEKLDQPLDVYIEWGRFDLFNPHENWDTRVIGKQAFDALQAVPVVTIRGGMVNDSSDWSSWRNRYREMLQTGTTTSR